MDYSEQMNAELFSGLTALSASTFPKKCNKCGEVYGSVEEFWQKTNAPGDRTGLKTGHDDNNRPIVELFRNCRCGSTLMDCFNDRRDISKKGLNNRELFDKLLKILNRRGIIAAKARTELLRMLHGERSLLLEKMGVRTKIR